MKEGFVEDVVELVFRLLLRSEKKISGTEVSLYIYAIFGIVCAILFGFWVYAKGTSDRKHSFSLRALLRHGRLSLLVSFAFVALVALLLATR
jgi:hypothetical protein